MKACVTAKEHLSPELQAAVEHKTLDLQAALRQHRANICNEYSSILLMTDRDAAAVRLELFISDHRNCPALLQMLSSEQSPYYEIEAFLLCCTIARAINAVCENVMRMCRKLMAHAGVSRYPLANYAGVVALAIKVIAAMRSSERERQLASTRSVYNRRARDNIVAQLPPAALTASIASSPSACDASETSCISSR